MKIFFDSKSTETGNKTPEIVQSKETQKFPEQILTKEIKLDKFYLNAYEKFVKNGGKNEDLKKFVNDILEGKIEGLKIENGIIKSEGQDGNWITIGMDQNNKPDLNFDFKNAITIAKQQQTETKNTDDDFEKDQKIQKAFEQNDYDKVIELLNLDTKKKSALIENLKKSKDSNQKIIEKWIKEKNINLEENSKNSLIWTTTLLFSLNLNKNIGNLKKISQDKNFDTQNYNNLYTPFLDFVEKNWGKGLKYNSIIFTNPMLAAEKIAQKNNIFDTKFSLDQNTQDFLMKNSSSLNINENKTFSELKKIFKDAIEFNGSPIGTQLAEGINAFKNLGQTTIDGILGNGQFQSLINENDSLKKWIENLGNKRIFKAIFGFLGYGSISEALNHKQESFFTRNLFSSIKNLEKSEFEKSKNIFGDIKFDQLKTAQLETIGEGNQKKDILLSGESLLFLQGFEPTIGTEAEKIKEFLPKMLKGEKVKVGQENFVSFYEKIQDLITGSSLDAKSKKSLETVFGQKAYLFENISNQTIFKTSNLENMLVLMQDFGEYIKSNPSGNFESWTKLNDSDKNFGLTKYLGQIEK